MGKRSHTDPDNWIAFDVETTGRQPEHALQPWSSHSWVSSFALFSPTHQQVCPSPERAAAHTDTEPAIREEMSAFFHKVHKEGLAVIGWNVAFDAAWCIKMGFREEVLQTRWLDGMSMWRHLTRVPESHLPIPKRKRYGLKAAVEEFLPDKAGYEADIDFHSTDSEAVAARLKYNLLDAEYTYTICCELMRQLNEPERRLQRRNFLIESSCIPLVADHYITGVHIDETAANELGGRLTVEQAHLKVFLEAHGANEKVLASPAQLSRLLYEDWGLPVIKTTDKGSPSTDKGALYELSFLDDRIEKMRRYREIIGNKKKFVDNPLESCRYNTDGVSHPTANINSTYTGRMTFSSYIGKNKARRQTGFALHQMKRDDDYRRPVTAPEGFTMVEWDAAGQEFRWVAIESGDETMLDLCLPGEDPHSYMASRMTDHTYPQIRELHEQGDKQIKEVRTAGKVGNLSCQYRISARSLLATARVDYNLPWDETMAKYVHSTYRRTYPGVVRYWAKAIARAQRAGYAETIAGRRVLLEGNWRGKDQWRLESTAINFRIQGIGADQKYLAMHVIKPLLTKYGGKFYFELHDGLYAVFPNKVAEKAGHEGRELLSNMPYKKAWGFTPPIPLPWDLKIGPNWGDSVEVR